MPDTSPSTRRSGARTGRALDAALVLLVVLAPVPVGGMYAPGQAIAAVLAVVLGLVVAIHALWSRSPWRWQPVAAVFVAAAALELLRASAFGAWMGGAFERDVVAAWGGGVELHGTAAPGRAPLAALRLLGAAALLQAWSMRARARGGTTRAVISVLGAAGLAFVSGVLHSATQADKVFGLYAPLRAATLPSHWAAPFVATNQAGALAGLGAVVLFGVAVSRPELRGRAVAGALLLAGSAAIALEAWAATIALVAGAVTLTTLHLMPLMRSRRFAAAAAGILGTCVTLGIAAAWFVLPSFRTELLGVDKAAMWRDAIAPVLSRPLGWGSGTFADAMGAFAADPYRLRYTFIESAPLDFGFDSGWLLLLALLVTGGQGLWSRWTYDRRSESDLRAATAGVAAYVALEGVGGLGLEADGYRFPVIALLGWMLGRAESRSQLDRAPAMSIAGAATLALLTCLCLPQLRVSAALGDRASYDYDAAFGGPRSSEDLAALIPADLSLLLAAAQRAVDDGALDTARPIVRHLERYAPGRPSTWELGVTLALHDGDRDAACAAARRMFDAAARPAPFVEQLRLIDADPKTWEACLGTRAARPVIFEGMSRLGMDDFALAVALDHLIGEPDDIESLRVAVNGLREWGQLAYASTLGARLLELSPTDARSAITLARLYAAQDRHEDALAAIRHALRAAPADVSLRVEELSVLSTWDAPGAAAYDAHFVESYHRLIGAVAARPGLAERRLRAGAAHFERRGMWAEAESALSALARSAPGNEAIAGRLETVRENRRTGARPPARRAQIDPATDEPGALGSGEGSGPL